MLGVGGRLPRSRDWSFLSIYTLRQFRSTSLACNPALIIPRAGHVLYFSRVYSPSTHPLSDMFLYLFLFIHCLILHLFSFISRRQRGLHGSGTLLQMFQARSLGKRLYKRLVESQKRLPWNWPYPQLLLQLQQAQPGNATSPQS